MEAGGRKVQEYTFSVISSAKQGRDHFKDIALCEVHTQVIKLTKQD